MSCGSFVPAHAAIIQVASLEVPSRCLGLVFRWPVPEGTNMQMHIPWFRTLAGGANEFPFTINLVDGQMLARSPECAGSLQPDGSSCPACAGLEQKLSELWTAIVSYKRHTWRVLLSTVQLYQALDDRNAELNNWKFKVS